MPQTKSSTREEALRQARELGRKEAELFDLRLREQEARQRERRLTEMAWVPGSPPGPTGEADSYEVAQLRARVDELSYYLKAVEDSGAWRAIQWVRGLFGRAW